MRKTASLIALLAAALFLLTSSHLLAHIPPEVFVFPTSKDTKIPFQLKLPDNWKLNGQGTRGKETIGWYFTPDDIPQPGLALPLTYTNESEGTNLFDVCIWKITGEKNEMTEAEIDKMMAHHRSWGTTLPGVFKKVRPTLAFREARVFAYERSNKEVSTLAHIVTFKKDKSTWLLVCGGCNEFYKKYKPVGMKILASFRYEECSWFGLSTLRR